MIGQNFIWKPSSKFISESNLTKYIKFISCQRYKTIDKLKPYIKGKNIKLNVNKSLFFDIL